MSRSNKSQVDSMPASMSRASTSEKAPAMPSAAIMTYLRLNRSAITPPKGESRAVGRSAATPAAASRSAEFSVVVMYQSAAKVAAQVARMEAAWPDQMSAMVPFQLWGKRWPLALTSILGAVASVVGTADDSAAEFAVCSLDCANSSLMAVLLICESVMLSSFMVNCGVTTRSSARYEKDSEQRLKGAQGTKPERVESRPRD